MPVLVKALERLKENTVMPAEAVHHRPVEKLVAKLRCPECRQGAIGYESPETLRCVHCGQVFPVIDGVPLLFPAASLPDLVHLDEERRKSGKMRKRSLMGGTYHWQEYHIRDFLPSATQGKEVLLLGCGDAGERPCLHELGFETIAFDIVRSSGTDLLADAHCLPLQDVTFDVVLSTQVLEHLHSPWLAVQEIARVLRPGGWFVGSVAFLKPYHNSYFHMTHKGVMHLLASQGLEVDKVMGAQSLTYTLYGTLLPLGKRSASKFVYGAFDRLLGSLRARLWAMHTGLDPDQPTNRFNTEMPLSFGDFEKLRFAPAIVFRAQKIVAGE